MAQATSPALEEEITSREEPYMKPSMSEKLPGKVQTAWEQNPGKSSTFTTKDTKGLES